LSWGFRLLEVLQQDPHLSAQTKQSLARVDINQVVTGTIDSICEQVLRDYRDPGTQPPILADEFVSRTLLLRQGLFNNRRDKDRDLDELLLSLHGNSRYGFHVGRKTELLQSIWERRYQDQVDWDDFLDSAPADSQRARQMLDDALVDYRQTLDERGMVDFSLLEQEMLNRLRAGQVTDFLNQIRVVLVDEYQDTNLMQDSIYYEMAKACHGALTVVGDDDQSLYRFRGATVELFSNFAAKYEQVFGQKLQPIFLKTNYRSTTNIISFVNNYALLDQEYQNVRVKSKPKLAWTARTAPGLPVLGLFRDDIEVLAADLADFIACIFAGNGYPLPDGTIIEAADEGGDLGDCALLCSSPAEYKRDGTPRLPRLLRDTLDDEDIAIFNPRGQDLTEIQLVEHFGGLLLECLDPGGAIEAQTNGLNDDIITVFRRWRTRAIDFVESAQAPAGLYDYALGWTNRDPGRRGYVWPRSVPVLDLIYGLVHYFSALHDDPEGQVYLEVFTRQVTACEQVGKFKGRVVNDPTNTGLSEKSVEELLRDFLGPIASGSIKVNEELLDAFPRDRLSILSIHQSKGLEFPLVIVDVGSDFKGNHAGHAFKRFPRDGSTPHRMEDLLRPHTPFSLLSRRSIDRAFDDLYVSFARVGIGW
jgi:DNA helicase-2/ATP-dependent DNA helicase PcrA